MYRMPRTFVIALGLLLGLGAISVEAQQLPSVTPLCADLSTASPIPSVASDDPPCCIDASKVALRLEDLPSQSYAMKEETSPGKYWRSFDATGPLPAGIPTEISTMIQPVATREMAIQAFTQQRDSLLKLDWEIVGTNLGVGDDSVAFGGRGNTMLWFLFRRGTYFVETYDIGQIAGYDRVGLAQATARAGIIAARLDGEIAKQRAASAPPAASPQSAPAFKLGFKTLADQLPADVVGTPVENEHFNVSNGNSEQHTTKGLMVWRKADNWTAYTNGYMTWINGPNGVQSRLNTDRFDWEKDAWQASPGPQATPTPAPTPAPAPLLAPGADWTVIDRSSDGFKVSLPPNWQQVNPRSTDLSGDLSRIFKDQPNGELAARVHAVSASAAKLMGGVLYAFPVTGESAAEPGSTQFKITKLAVPASTTLDQIVAQTVTVLNQQASQGIIGNLAHHRTALPAGDTEVFTYLETINLEGMPEMKVAVLDSVLVQGGYAYELVFATVSSSGVNEIAQVGYAIGQSFQFTSPAPQASAGIQPIKLLQTGYGQEIDDTNAGFGFIVENPNDGFILDGTYTVTAYDDKGASLKTISDTIGVVLPKQRLGIGGYLLRLPNSRVARIDVQLQTTTFTPSPRLPFITASNVVYNAGKYAQGAIADLSNPYDRDVNKPNVFAIVYNADGVIIGGGSAKTILSIPAHGQTKGGAEIASSGPPSRIEIYAQPTYNAGWPW